jgi:hypothetical protein
MVSQSLPGSPSAGAGAAQFTGGRGWCADAFGARSCIVRGGAAARGRSGRTTSMDNDRGAVRPRGPHTSRGRTGHGVE